MYRAPGVVMILQVSDALSRGVWITPFQDTMDQRALTAAVFVPLSPNQSLIQHSSPNFSHRWITSYKSGTLSGSQPHCWTLSWFGSLLPSWPDKLSTSCYLIGFSGQGHPRLCFSSYELFPVFGLVFPVISVSLLFFSRVTSLWPPSQSCPFQLSSYILPLMFPPFR